MQSGEQQAGQQVGNRQWPQKSAADEIPYQFLYQAAKRDFLKHRVCQYGNQKLPGFKQGPAPLNCRLLDNIQRQPDKQTSQQRYQEQGILPG